MIIDKIGAEVEGSKDDCVFYREKFFGEHILGYGYENSYIYENNITPVDSNNFMEFLRTFMSITYVDDFEYHEGADDTYATSMHLHISFKDMQGYEGVNNIKFAIPLLFALFSKKSYSYFFRDVALTNNSEDYIRAMLSTNWVGIRGNRSSKSYWVTPSNHGNNGTLEFRVNENTLPLWVYMFPVLSQIDAEFSELCNRMMQMYSCNCECMNLGFVASDLAEVKQITEEAVDIALTTLPKVLEHWKPLVSNYKQFETIMTKFYEFRFDNVKMFKYLSKYMRRSAVWRDQYLSKFNERC